mmetsp:Transcript_36911/g.72592  ORF Transcript_36911/g.72592 Transcript_36911/m.72592 type:complete len:276 (+) Transcript_36911:111-938(+)
MLRRMPAVSHSFAVLLATLCLAALPASSFHCNLSNSIPCEGFDSAKVGRGTERLSFRAEGRRRELSLKETAMQTEERAQSRRGQLNSWRRAAVGLGVLPFFSPGTSKALAKGGGGRSPGERWTEDVRKLWVDDVQFSPNAIPPIQAALDAGDMNEVLRRFQIGYANDAIEDTMKIVKRMKPELQEECGMGAFLEIMFELLKAMDKDRRKYNLALAQWEDAKKIDPSWRPPSADKKELDLVVARFKVRGNKVIDLWKRMIDKFNVVMEEDPPRLRD